MNSRLHWWINCKKGDEIEIRFHPGVDFFTGENEVKLFNEKAEMQMVSFGNIASSIMPKRIPRVPLRMDEDFEWHHYFSIQAEADAGDNFLGNAFIPAKTGLKRIEFIQKKDSRQIFCHIGGDIIIYDIEENTVKRSID